MLPALTSLLSKHTLALFHSPLPPEERLSPLSGDQGVAEVPSVHPLLLLSDAMEASYEYTPLLPIRGD